MRYDHNDPQTLLLVADALDVSPDKLLKSARTCELLSELFDTSPHSGRGKAAMVSARLMLSDVLLHTLHRHEVEEALGTDPFLANQVLLLLEKLRDSADWTARQCKKATMTVAASSSN